MSAPKPPVDLHALRDMAKMFMDSLDRGVSPQALRDRLAAAGLASSGAAAMLDLAIELHRLPSADDETTAPPVRNPRYQKGTARKPVTWDKCLWKPQF